MGLLNRTMYSTLPDHTSVRPLGHLGVERRGRKLTLKPWFPDSPPRALARENRSVLSVSNKPSLVSLVGVPYLKKPHSITGCVI